MVGRYVQFGKILDSQSTEAETGQEGVPSMVCRPRLGTKRILEFDATMGQHDSMM